MKYIFAGYIICLHIVLGLAIYDPYFIINQKWRLGLADTSQNLKEDFFYKEFSGIAPLDQKKTNIILGSSHLRRFNHAALNETFINLAIGGQKIKQFEHHINKLQLLNNVGKVILLIGGNDILHDDQTADFVFKKTQSLTYNLKNAQHFFIITLPPVGKTLYKKMGHKIEQLNAQLNQFCSQQSNCTAIDIYPELVSSDGLLKDIYNVGDDLHLSKAAYAKISDKINASLNTHKMTVK